MIKEINANTHIKIYKLKLLKINKQTNNKYNTAEVHFVQASSFSFSASVALSSSLFLERATLVLRVPLFLLGHFQTNESEALDFC